MDELLLALESLLAEDPDLYVPLRSNWADGDKVCHNIALFHTDRGYEAIEDPEKIWALAGFDRKLSGAAKAALDPVAPALLRVTACNLMRTPAWAPEMCQFNQDNFFVPTMTAEEEAAAKGSASDGVINMEEVDRRLFVRQMVTHIITQNGIAPARASNVSICTTSKTDDWIGIPDHWAIKVTAPGKPPFYIQRGNAEHPLTASLEFTGAAGTLVTEIPITVSARLQPIIRTWCGTDDIRERVRARAEARRAAVAARAAARVPAAHAAVANAGVVRQAGARSPDSRAKKKLKVEPPQE